MQPKDFAMLCFLILMQNDKGIESKAPNYILEKQEMLQLGFDAFTFLDFYNMAKLITYLNKWKIQVHPKIQMEYDNQVAAMEELRDQGVLL